MVSRNALLALVLIGSFAAMRLHAESIVQDIIGEKPPYVLGRTAEDTVYAWQAVKQEVIDTGKQCIDGGKLFSGWTLGQLNEKGSTIFRVVYQLTKIAAGGYACRYTLYDLDVFGTRAKGMWQAVDQAPRIVGLGLILHGLKGLSRECGFNSLGEIYHYAENHKPSDPSKPAKTTKPAKPAQKRS